MNVIRFLAVSTIVFLAAPLDLPAQSRPADPASRSPSGRESGQESGRAAGQPSGPSSVEDRLEYLDQKVKVLERRNEIDKEEAAAKAKEAPVLGAGKDGFSLKSQDGAFQLKLRGYVHADSRFFLLDDEQPNSNTFTLRRVRPIFEGTLFKIFDFRIMPDFAEGRTVLQDTYLDVRLWNELNVRAGKFKTPFGIERLQSATDMRFIERALPNNLVPNRDLGVQLHGSTLNGALSYQAGVFNGVPDGGSGDLDNTDEKDFAGRIFALPFKDLDIDFLQGFGAGIAGTIGNQKGPLPSFKTTGQAAFFSYAANASATGLRTRFSPQGHYYRGPFGLLGEYVLSSQEVRRLNTKRKIDNDAWQVTLSYVLTGEDASYKGVEPKKPFDLALGQWGALEVVGRFSSLEVDSQAFPIFSNPSTSAEKAASWGGGLNWYLNKNIKIALDFDWTKFHNGKARGSREEENVILQRFQFSF